MQDENNVPSPAPTPTMVDTSCGMIPVDSSIDAFNQLQLDAHNTYRTNHHSKNVAYDAILAQ